MIIFKILSNLYTNKSSKWIKEVNDSDVQPFVIQRWLCMNTTIRSATRWLDKYVFYLSPKMYLSLAWSVIPKSNKAPFIKYIKKEEDDAEFNFIIPKIRQHLNLSDNDWNANKTRVIQMIKDDTPKWFSFYGVPKKYWVKYKQDYNLIKAYGKREEPKQKGLNAWG